MTPEEKVKRECLLEVGTDSDVCIWIQTAGKFHPLGCPERVISIGEPGMADSCMGVAVTITPEMVGRRVAILCQPEFKRPKKGKQQENQARWQKAMQRIGAYYRLITSADEIRDMVEKAKKLDF